MISSQTNDIMSMFIKKTVESSKNNDSIEDFAAWVLSNFNLKSNSVSDTPKYSRVKPKSEDVQKHFQQFLKKKEDRPKPNVFLPMETGLDDLVAKSNDLTAQEFMDEASQTYDGSVTDIPEVQDLMKDLASILSVPGHVPAVPVTTYSDVVEGVIARSVDSTPQINYTCSNDSALNNVSSSTSLVDLTNANYTNSTYVSAFQPTQKEIDSANKISTMAVAKPKRGRKTKGNKS